jgi:hypothetical protein
MSELEQIKSDFRNGCADTACKLVDFSVGTNGGCRCLGNRSDLGKLKNLIEGFKLLLEENQNLCDKIEKLNSEKTRNVLNDFDDFLALHEENKKMRECLGWYADESNWGMTDRCTMYSELIQAQDGFKKAQDCLQELEAGE